MHSSLYSVQLFYSSYFRPNSSKKITYGVLLLFYKALEDGEINEGTDELERSQRRKLKVMDPRKLAFVREYIEHVQDTCSMTTEVTDSGLGTHAAASELGTEEINGKLVMLFYSTITNIVKRNFPNRPVSVTTMN